MYCTFTIVGSGSSKSAPPKPTTFSRPMSHMRCIASTSRAMVVRLSDVCSFRTARPPSWLRLVLARRRRSSW